MNSLHFSDECGGSQTFLLQIGGTDAATFPIQKKKLTREYLRSIAHLRPRTNTFGAVSPCLARKSTSFLVQQVEPYAWSGYLLTQPCLFSGGALTAFTPLQGPSGSMYNLYSQFLLVLKP